MSDVPVPDQPNRSFDTLSFEDAERFVTEKLLQSASPQEALKILKAVPDRKDVGVDLVLDEFQSGSVKVRLKEGQPDTTSDRRKDIGALFPDGRIVTRQMPNLLPDLEWDSNAKK